MLVQLLQENVPHNEERVGQFGLQLLGQVELLLLVVQVEHLEVLLNGQDRLDDLVDAVLDDGCRLQVELGLGADLVVPGNQVAKDR